MMPRRREAAHSGRFFQPEAIPGSFADISQRFEPQAQAELAGALAEIGFFRKAWHI